MFDDPQEPKDMFADVPEIEPATRKIGDSAPSAESVPQPQVMSPEQAMAYEAPKGASKMRIAILVIISLAAVGGAGYAAFRFMVKDAVPQQISDVIEQKENENTPTNVNEGSQGETSGENTVQSEGQKKNDEGNIAVIDSDGDGLTNEEERIAGTSVAKPDTDADGLGDREEVKFYETDPIKPDTDGDGYMDGEEVKNGYNPNGEGKLLEIPKNE